jgi:hypothetical protein
MLVERLAVGSFQSQSASLPATASQLACTLPLPSCLQNFLYQEGLQNLPIYTLGISAGAAFATKVGRNSAASACPLCCVGWVLSSTSKSATGGQPSNWVAAGRQELLRRQLWRHPEAHGHHFR